MACVHYCRVVTSNARREAFSFLISSSRFFKNSSPSSSSSSSIPCSYNLRFRHHYRSRLVASYSSSSSSSSSSAAAVATKEDEHQQQQQQQQQERPILSSKDLVALEYADLDLTFKVSDDVGHVRIRQHVNPLTDANSVPAQVPDWNQVFRDTTLPLMVDIGTGSGRFLLWHAKKNADSRNHLGLEIRKKLVKRANFWVKELPLHNIFFMVANATVSFQQLVSTYPGPLMLVSILCPDPHFKKKHHKRRVVQKSLVDSIVQNLAPGGQIFLESDVIEVALDMRNQFDAESDTLQNIDAIDPSMMSNNEGWLISNPVGIRSEREIHAEFEGGTVYRRMYIKRI